VATPLETWVDEAAKLTKPERVAYCDGSEAEFQRMIARCCAQGFTPAEREDLPELLSAPQQSE